MASTIRKLPRVKPKTYTTCLLYHTEEAREKLKGITLAACNPKYDRKVVSEEPETSKVDEITAAQTVDLTQLTVSETMSCNYCDVQFENRLEQKRHYRSDWHRYNLKLRIRGKTGISEEQFEIISGNISSLSGTDTEDENASDVDTGNESSTSRRLAGVASKLDRAVGGSSTDSESESNQMEEAARRLPKIYFKNEAGELLSLYRCVITHKKNQPATTEDLITMTTSIPDVMTWAVFMAGGGHFAAAIFSKDKILVHKTFHRYVVRAKRGTAQSSRDSQGSAPKSGGASLRRYNETALTEEIQELISSWKDQIQACSRIFLRAPSFNRKIFFGGKTPPLNKDDLRIRLIPFETRRPTFNEVRRVYEVLASIECYGEETDIQEFIPISPQKTFNRETGQLEIKDENSLSPRHRRLLNKKLRASPLAGDTNEASSANAENSEVVAKVKSTLPGHVIVEEVQSSGASTTSEAELVDMMQTINMLDLKEHGGTKKPKRKKKSGKKRSGLQKYQTEPESNVMEEEKYHLKNSLYTACKIGDVKSLKSLLAVFLPNLHQLINQTGSKITEDLATSESEHGLKPDLDGKSVEIRAEIVESDNSVNVSNDTKEGVDVNIETMRVSDDYKEKLEEVKVSGETVSVVVNQQAFIGRGSNSAGNHEQKTVIFKESSTSNITYSESSKNSETIKEIPSDTNNISNQTSENNRELKIDPSGNIIASSDVNSLKSAGDINVKTGDMNNKALGESLAPDANTSSDPDITNISGKQAPDHSLIDSEGNTPLNNTIPNNLNLTNKQGQSPSFIVPVQSLPDMSPVVTAAILNEPFGDSDATLLHVAAREGHKAVLYLLLQCGATPAVKDKSGQTPFVVSKDKSVRNEFRKFMGSWPDRYDYVFAQIPAPLSEEREAEKKKKEAERKKLQKKEKKERLKEKKEEEDRKKAEEKERNRYLNLSDREKRALAAERRLLQQVTQDGGDTPVLSRCFQCASDMTGKVPFEYNDNKFCNPKCLQLHRKSKTSKS